MTRCCLRLCVACALAHGALAGTTTFDDGIEGWGLFFANDGTLGDFLEPDDGNPGAHLRWLMVDTFGATLRNDTNPEVLGDYRRFGNPVRLAVDVRVASINFFFQEVPRNLIVELVHYNPPGSNYPWVSVWYNLGEISSAETAAWQRLEVTIDDANAAALPAGWGGTGDEDPNTFEPRLPPGRTFASVLANVEEIRFTTYEPGYFYGFTNFALRFDNPTVVAVGCASAPGDANCDGLVNFDDISCFVAGLISDSAWNDCGPADGCDYVCANDANASGTVDFDDIEAFVTCLISGCP